MIRKIINKLKSFNVGLDHKKIELVMSVADESFIKNRSKSILDVLSYILPLNPDEDTLVAVFLYYLGNSDLNSDKIQKLFGKNVSELLSGVRKLESLDYKQNEKESQLEVFRKMILAVAKDLRVVLIVLVNRLVCMKNIKKTEPKGNIAKFANQTLEIYVSVAARLGMYRIKTDLEDLALRYVNPVAFRKTHRQIRRFVKEKKLAIDEVQHKIKNFLKEKGYFTEVKGRIKSIYSTYNKLKRKNFASIDDLYDIFAIRIISPSQYDENGVEIVDHLYSILGLVHSEWRPLSRRFKDFIAVPKPNGYRSLHTVVLGLAPEYIDKPVEIQIRSEDMEREAEYGVSSHWIYKQYDLSDTGAETLKQQVDWLKGLQRINEEFSMGVDLSEIGLDIFKDRIFVLTPKGEVKDLPSGATPIDFAYAVHTEIGNRCGMAKVNGSVVSLDYLLQNGDVVEIITKKDGTPKLQWLSIAKTGFAKNKIKAYFSLLNRDSHIKEGKRLINSHLERLSKSKLDQAYSILKNYGRKDLTVLQRERVLEEVGKGSRLASDVIRKIFPYEEMALEDAEKAVKRDKASVSRIFNVQREQPLTKQIIVGGEDNLPLKMASCCKPKMGDKIIAYVTKNAYISIHKMSCDKIDNLNKKKFVFAEWKAKGESLNKKYRAEVRLTASSRVGLIRDVTAIISSLDIMIVDMKMEGSVKNSEKHNYFFTLEFDDPKRFDLMLDKLENIEGVERVIKL